MFDQLSAEIVPSLIKGRHNTNNNNNKAKCIPAVHCVYSRVKNAFCKGEKPHCLAGEEWRLPFEGKKIPAHMTLVIVKTLYFCQFVGPGQQFLQKKFKCISMYYE
jgi:hypothetical protein